MVLSKRTTAYNYRTKLPLIHIHRQLYCEMSRKCLCPIIVLLFCFLCKFILHLCILLVMLCSYLCTRNVKIAYTRNVVNMVIGSLMSVLMCVYVVDMCFVQDDPRKTRPSSVSLAEVRQPSYCEDPTVNLGPLPVSEIVCRLCSFLSFIILASSKRC